MQTRMNAVSALTKKEFPNPSGRRAIGVMRKGARRYMNYNESNMREGLAPYLEKMSYTV
jgi:hypothetical protein